jgi:pimeloyl-ACP methyl ester carboxylesterase
MDFVAQTITVNGAKVALKRGGAGAPLLFLHGADGLPEWPEILDDLAQSYDVIAPDLPGFGLSEAPPFVDDISDVAYLLMDMLEQMDLRGVRVVGHSLGGWAALEMAVRSCERIHSIALIAPAGIHVKGSPKADIYMIDPDEQARIAYADPELGAQAAARAMVSKHQTQAILNRIASARLGWNPRLYNPRLERWLHRVKAPTMIIWGDTDRIIPPVYADAFAGFMPTAKLAKIKHAGHLPHVEKRDEVGALLKDFLKG